MFYNTVYTTCTLELYVRLWVTTCSVGKCFPHSRWRRARVWRWGGRRRQRCKSSPLTCYFFDKVMFFAIIFQYVPTYPIIQSSNRNIWTKTGRWMKNEGERKHNQNTKPFLWHLSKTCRWQSHHDTDKWCVPPVCTRGVEGPGRYWILWESGLSR